ncbi:hypothetical protein EDB19DRAFT_1999230 [Suillus lakei]|nr:hypothetical protein EDB19DRAFT_1999230 [Suillus lakei]
MVDGSLLPDLLSTKPVWKKRVIGPEVCQINCLGSVSFQYRTVKSPTRGYEERLADVINDVVFAEDRGGVVVVRNIHISGLCEYHMVPFTGKVFGLRVGRQTISI